MGDNINQENVFGGNFVKSIKSSKVKIILTKQRVQGFLAGILTSILASYVYDLIKPLL